MVVGREERRTEGSEEKKEEDREERKGRGGKLPIVVFARCQ